MMPTETIQAFKDLNANILFPIHNSSFKLSMHPWNEPLEMINNLAKEDNIKVSHPKMGEIIPLLEYKETDIWWK
jgi:L-ascorbate metabolism protein UlaG (beta-lactamase superfamily)